MFPVGHGGRTCPSSTTSSPSSSFNPLHPCPAPGCCSIRIGHGRSALPQVLLPFPPHRPTPDHRPFAQRGPPSSGRPPCSPGHRRQLGLWNSIFSSFRIGARQYLRIGCWRACLELLWLVDVCDEVGGPAPGCWAWEVLGSELDICMSCIL